VYLFILLSSGLHQAVSAIPEDDRIDEFTALHAAPRQEVDVTAILQKILAIPMYMGI
jgi:hypothetical protein